MDWFVKFINIAIIEPGFCTTFNVFKIANATLKFNYILELIYIYLDNLALRKKKKQKNKLFKNQY